MQNKQIIEPPTPVLPVLATQALGISRQLAPGLFRLFDVALLFPNGTWCGRIFRAQAEYFGYTGEEKEAR